MSEKRFNKKTYIIIYTENFDLFNHSSCFKKKGISSLLGTVSNPFTFTVLLLTVITFGIL